MVVILIFAEGYSWCRTVFGIQSRLFCQWLHLVGGWRYAFGEAWILLSIRS